MKLLVKRYKVQSIYRLFGVTMELHCELEKAKIGLSNKDKENRGMCLGLRDQLTTESPHYF